MTTTSVQTLKQCLNALGFADRLKEMSKALETSLPPGTIFEDEIWNIISWHKVPGRAETWNLDFSRVKNPELRNILKTYLLHKRVRRSQSDKGFGINAARMDYDAVRVLDVTLNMKSMQQWSNADFQAAEGLLEAKYASGTSARLADALQNFARWLNIYGNLRLSYVSGLKNTPRHGLLGTEEGRTDKLIPFPVIRDLLALSSRDDLHLRDRFFVNAMVLLVATGLRINELMTLPVDCLVRQENTVGLRYFVEKKGTEGIKWIATDFADAVTAALEFLTKTTAPGRAAALSTESRAGAVLDWPAIYADEKARTYFISLLLHEWTSRPRNNLFNPEGAWFERDKKYVDVIGLLARHNGSWKWASKELQTDPVRLRGLHDAQQSILAGHLPNGGRGLKKKNQFQSDSRGASLDMIRRETGYGALYRTSCLQAVPGA